MLCDLFYACSTLAIDVCLFPLLVMKVPSLDSLNFGCQIEFISWIVVVCYGTDATVEGRKLEGLIAFFCFFVFCFFFLISFLQWWLLSIEKHSHDFQNRLCLASKMKKILTRKYVKIYSVAYGLLIGYAGLCINHKQELPWPDGAQGRSNIFGFPIYSCSIRVDRLRYWSKRVLAVRFYVNNLLVMCALFLCSSYKLKMWANKFCLRNCTILRNLMRIRNECEPKYIFFIKRLVSWYLSLSCWLLIQLWVDERKLGFDSIQLSSISGMRNIISFRFRFNYWKYT